MQDNNSQDDQICIMQFGGVCACIKSQGSSAREEIEPCILVKKSPLKVSRSIPDWKLDLGVSASYGFVVNGRKCTLQCAGSSHTDHELMHSKDISAHCSFLVAEIYLHFKAKTIELARLISLQYWHFHQRFPLLS